MAEKLKDLCTGWLTDSAQILYGDRDGCDTVRGGFDFLFDSCHLISDIPDFLNHIFPTFWAFLYSVIAHSRESFGLKLTYKRYFMPNIQQINLGFCE